MKVTMAIITLLFIAAHSVNLYQYHNLSQRYQKLANDLEHTSSSIDAQFNERYEELANKLDLAANELEQSNSQIKQLKMEMAVAKTSIDALSKLPTLEEIAAVLINSANAQLVTAIANKLVNDHEYYEKLRGPKGDMPPPPSVEKVVEVLFSEYFNINMITESVASVLMENMEFKQQVRGEKGETGESPTVKDVMLYLNREEGLIADIAEAVYQIYGKALQGEDGKNGEMPPPEKIAELLSNSYEFAQLVADFKESDRIGIGYR